MGGAHCGDGASMDKDKSLRQAETEPASRCGPALLAPEEPVKNVRQVLFRYAGARILHDNRCIFSGVPY